LVKKLVNKLYIGDMDR